MAFTQSKVIVGVGDSFKVATYGTVEGSATDLGATEGGIEVLVDREYYEKTVDQAIGILELIKLSEKPKLKVTLAECTLDNLRIAMDYPSTALVGSTLTFGGNATVTELVIYANVIGVTGGTRKLTLYKCVNISSATHAYKKGDKNMIEMEFLILQDTTKAANEQVGTFVDSAADTTAPTIALTTPTDGNTVAKTTTDPVIWTYVETNAIDEGSVKYGDDDDATFILLNTTVPATADVEPGTISLDIVAKTVTFTPTVAWNASDTFQAIVTTGFKDANGNRLAAIKIEQFSVTA